MEYFCVWLRLFFECVFCSLVDEIFLVCYYGFVIVRLSVGVDYCDVMKEVVVVIFVLFWFLFIFGNDENFGDLIFEFYDFVLRLFFFFWSSILDEEFFVIVWMGELWELDVFDC